MPEFCRRCICAAFGNFRKTSDSFLLFIGFFCWKCWGVSCILLSFAESLLEVSGRYSGNVRSLRPNRPHDEAASYYSIPDNRAVDFEPSLRGFRINVKTWGILILRINFRQPKQKESLIFHSPKLWAKVLYVSIKGFRSCVRGTSLEVVYYFKIMCLYWPCYSSKGKESWFIHFIIPPGKPCQGYILMSALVINQS